MADNNNLNEENSFYLDPNIKIKRSYSYTNYLFYNRSIDTQNNPINRKYIGQFVLGEKLGQGTFGIVVLGTHQITGEKVAVKILDKEKILQETDKSRLEREIKILKNMRHNNIVHLYDVKETPTSLYIIMEYICGKELFEYIIYNKRLSELEACKYYQQIISGIEYLGKIKVVHRDIKPENLLLDNKNNIKIVDFGLSNSYPKNELLITACGSPCYAAPEMINGEKYYGLKADIWSSGIVLYAMLCGYLPFEEADNEKLYKKITEGKFKTPNFLSDSAKDILHRILNVDPKSRITIPQMKKHPWFNLVNPKLNMTEGLLLNKVIVPIDENIIYKMVNEYKFNGEEVRTNLLLNNHNHITTTYFLILNQKLRNGEKSIGNMKSKEFLKYIHSPTNWLSHYGNNMKKIVQLRSKGINIDNKQSIEEKDNKNKINKNSINALSTEAQSDSNGLLKIKCSVEKLKKKEKRESSVKQRKIYDIENKNKNNKNKIISIENKNTQNKNNPKSVDTKTKKNEKNEKNAVIKEKNNKISVTPDLKIKQIKGKDNKDNNEINKNKKRNTEIKNKKKLITGLKSEEKENRKDENYMLEEIEEIKDINIKNYKNKDDSISKNNKLNKKAITIKNVIHSRKKQFEISIKESNRKENDRKQKIKRLVEKKNITEKRIEIKSYNENKENELNDIEKENEDLIVNTDINKYVKLSKLMRRMKVKKQCEKNNNSKINKFSLEEDYPITSPKVNITEQEYILKNKEIEKQAITDRYDNEIEMYKIPKKRNIIANIYNYKYQKKNNSINNKRPIEKEKEKIEKKNNKKRFIDTSVSFDKTNDEIKVNKDSILLTDEINHIEEKENSDLESSKENQDISNYNNNDKNNEKEKENEKEEEEFKRKEKDIKYLKLKSKHKKFNIVKPGEEKINSLKYSYKNNKDKDKDKDNKDNINNNILIKNFKKTKTKNDNDNINKTSTMYTKPIKYKNILLANEKIKILNNQKNRNMNHHTTINNYPNHLNESKKKYMTEKNENSEINNNNNNSSNSIDNELNCNTLENNHKIYNTYNSYSNKNKKNNKNKNKELSFIYDEENNYNNNDMKLFDLNSINYYKNYNDVKDLKEKIKKELENKKIKFNLKKNTFYCNHKDAKFNIEIDLINDVKNIYIIKCIKKLGNILQIKYNYKFILTKLNSS